MLWPALGCAGAGAVVFQFFGNATRGYIDTASAFGWWVRQWLDPRAEAEHGWLILAIAAWLLARNLRNDGESPTEAAVRPVAPAVAMVAALGLHAMGFVAQQTRLSLVALLLFAWGVIALADRRWGRAAVFPLAFMLFAVPVNVLDSAGFWLRLWVIDAATALAHLGGIGVLRSGTQLFAPDGHFQYDVAAACSGVRSLMALLALSLLIGYMSFRAPWRRGLMLALCLPLTYVGNLARIGAIIVAAQLGGQAWGERVHAVMGLGVFVIVLGGVLAVAGWLGRRWPEEPRPNRAATEPAARPRRAAIAVAGLVAVLAAGEAVLLGHLAALPATGTTGLRLSADGRAPADLPATLGADWFGRAAEVTAAEHEILPADTGFSRRDYVPLAAPTHRVFLSIVLSGRDRTSIHRPELCLVAQGWTLTGTATHGFAWPGRPDWVVPATLLRTVRTEPRTGRRVEAIVAYWFVNGDTVVATHWQRLWRDALNRLRGRADRWGYVLMQTDTADGEAVALARLQTVLDQTLPGFQRVAARKP